MKRLSALLLLIVALFIGTAVASAATFTRDLTIGSTGADVVELQTFLEDNNLLFMPAGESKGYFGALTQNGVKVLQMSFGITPANGYFGSVTREFVNRKIAEHEGRFVPVASTTVVVDESSDSLPTTKINIVQPKGKESYSPGDKITVSFTNAIQGNKYAISLVQTGPATGVNANIYPLGEETGGSSRLLGKTYTVPFAAIGTYRVEVYDLISKDKSLSGEFVIQKPNFVATVGLVKPQAGGKVKAGGKITIALSKMNATEKYEVRLRSADGASSTVHVLGTIVGTKQKRLTRAFTVPGQIAGGEYVIEVGSMGALVDCIYACLSDQTEKFNVDTNGKDTLEVSDFVTTDNLPTSGPSIISSSQVKLTSSFSASTPLEFTKYMNAFDWTWSTNPEKQPVDIYLLDNKGKVVHTFAKNHSGSRYNWTPGLKGDIEMGSLSNTETYTMATCPYGENSHMSPSCGVFTFKLAEGAVQLQVMRPRGDVVVSPGEKIEVEFNDVVAGEIYTINLVKMEIGTSENYVTTKFATEVGSKSKNFSKSYTIPSNTASGLYYFEIVNYASKGKSCYSNVCARGRSSEFKVTSSEVAPSITLTQPKGVNKAKAGGKVKVSIANMENGGEYSVRLLGLDQARGMSYDLATEKGTTKKKINRTYTLPSNITSGGYVIEVQRLHVTMNCPYVCPRAESRRFEVTAPIGAPSVTSPTLPKVPTTPAPVVAKDYAINLMSPVSGSSIKAGAANALKVQTAVQNIPNNTRAKAYLISPSGGETLLGQPHIYTCATSTSCTGLRTARGVLYTIPKTTAPGSGYKVRVDVDINGVMVSDTSDGFTVTSQNTTTTTSGTTGSTSSSGSTGSTNSGTSSVVNDDKEEEGGKGFQGTQTVSQNHDATFLNPTSATSVKAGGDIVVKGTVKEMANTVKVKVDLLDANGNTVVTRTASVYGCTNNYCIGFRAATGIRLTVPKTAAAGTYTVRATFSDATGVIHTEKSSDFTIVANATSMLDGTSQLGGILEAFKSLIGR